ncbi:MAG: MFS transporter [Candidatus Hodarchaeota archaeon]
MKRTKGAISSRLSLISAVFVHASVEIPFFIFPVIIIVVGEDPILFNGIESYKWIILGLIGSISSLSIALPSPLFGWLADRHRKGSLMAFSLIISAIGSFIVGLFSTSIFTFLIGTVLTGVGVSLYHPPGLTWVSNAYENPATHSYSQKFSGALGIHGMGGTFGAAIAPMSVYLLIETFNWRQIYFFWSIPLVLFALIFWVLIGRFEPPVENSSIVPELHTSSTNEKSNNRSNGTILFSFLSFLIAMALIIGMINFILSPFLSEVKNLRISEAAFFLGLSTFLGAFGQLIGGVLGDKYGEKATLLFSTSLLTICLVSIYIISNYLVLLILYIFLLMSFAIFWPISSSFLAKLSSHRGAAFGWFLMIANIIRSFGPGLDGLLISVDPQQYFLIFLVSVFLSFGALISALFFKTGENRISPVQIE